MSTPSPCTRRLRHFLYALGCYVLGACAGPGPYGFARTYEPLMSERGHLEEAQQLPYEQVKADPYQFKKTKIAWFGVVTSIDELPDGRSALQLAFRAHQARHLCRDEFEDSCRVTVAERSSGAFVARLTLREAQKTGKERVWLGSLLKVYGTPTGDYDEHGNPVLDVAYYRHWPRGYYVTTAQRGAMRR